ncbi:ABC transporter permease [Clostridium hydrogenum]|uniref:ABC transporter permease n=1 Tax=Clostridium hydrogenum TaxID=2855764 RepID=UPI001F2E2358|nr:ABC transporter permease [Clostridium hydrogenum]
MRVINIIRNDLKKYYRNAAFIILVLVGAPMLIGFVETCIFYKDYNGQSTLNKFSISFVDKDKSFYGTMLKKMLTSKEIKKTLNVQIDSDENRAESKVKNDEVSAAIIVPKNFTKNFIENRPKDIKLLKSPMDTINDNVVEGILKSFTDEISLKSSKVSYVDTTIIKKQSRVSAAQHYYTVMFSTFIVLSVFIFGSDIIEEKNENVLARISSTGTNKYIYFYSKLGSTFIMCIIETIIYIILTSIIFDVDYGSNYVGILSIIFSGSVAITGLTAIGIGIIKKLNVFRIYSCILYMVMGIFSGSFALTLETLPQKTAQFAPYTFNYNYYKAYNVLMLGGNMNSILNFILKLSIFGIIASILGSIIFKVEVNN